jgi:SnoaL-like domain
MEESAAVREGIQEFFARLSAGDMAGFDDVVSSHPATLVIGTAPGEWVTERDRLKFGFEAEGYRGDPDDPTAYEEGDLGWVVDNPTFHFGPVDVNARLTAILRREGDRWKLVHMHVSVGVPDEEVLELRERSA